VGDFLKDFDMVRTPEREKMVFRITLNETLIINPESQARNSFDRLRTGLNNIKT
jgi:hypothetical protein